MLSESSDQSGMVGFLVGIIVLVFVGIGFSLVVDKRFRFSSGKAELQQTITDEKHQLDTLRRQTDFARKGHQEKSQPLMDQPAELEKVKLAASTSAGRVKELREQQAALKDSVEADKSAFAEYRATFRKQARQAAAGEKLAQLEVIGGKVYRDVTIRRVTSAGMEVVHSQGVLRLSPDDLGDSWHQRFQWDAEETAETVHGEKAAADQHEKQVEKQLQGRQEPVKQEKPEPELSPEKLAKQEADKKLASLRREVTDAKRRLERAEMEASRARSDSMSSRARSVPGSLETWGERITRLESATEAFRSQYMAARGRLATVAPDDSLLRDSASQ
jgi:hypothetical protein